VGAGSEVSTIFFGFLCAWDRGGLESTKSGAPTFQVRRESREEHRARDEGLSLVGGRGDAHASYCGTGWATLACGRVPCLISRMHARARHACLPALSSLKQDSRSHTNSSQTSSQQGHDSALWVPSNRRFLHNLVIELVLKRSY
jgi:hypothetical protein